MLMAAAAACLRHAAGAQRHDDTLHEIRHMPRMHDAITLITHTHRHMAARSLFRDIIRHAFFDTLLVIAAAPLRLLSLSPRDAAFESFARAASAYIAIRHIELFDTDTACVSVVRGVTNCKMP